LEKIMVDRFGDPKLAGRIRENLALPVIAAPMFLVSGPDLVIAAAHSGIIGAVPALNQRTTEGFESWLEQIKHATAGALYAVNLIVHDSNGRIEADLTVAVRHRVPLIIASIGSPAPVVERVRDYGGLVFSDVASVRHARRAVEAGVDGLILLCAGAGGNTGWLNPFAFLAEVRRFWGGPVALAGAISRGSYVHLAEEMGADFAFVGTPFIAARESLAPDAYRSMLVESGADDIVLTAEVTGIPANMLRRSLEKSGYTPRKGAPARFDLNAEIETLRAWRDIWSAGHGVGDVKAVESLADIVDRFSADYRQARQRRSV
jgi:nitronate monooxygenase